MEIPKVFGISPFLIFLINLCQFAFSSVVSTPFLKDNNIYFPTNSQLDALDEDGNQF